MLLAAVLAARMAAFWFTGRGKASGAPVEMTLISVGSLRDGLVYRAFAAGPASATSTGTPGQPNQDCEALAASGGNRAPGFGTAGFANAQNHYANSQNGAGASSWRVLD